MLRVRLPFAPGRETRYRKVGTRRAQAISKVVIALAWRDEASAVHLGPRVWREVRLALGSVAPTPIRARATERLLEGSRPTPETADRAADIARRARSSRSTTSARRPTTGGRSRRGSSIGSSASEGGW